MSETRRNTGALGEKLAEEHLKKHGYEILHRNYRTSLGEIDIVAREGDCLVFVEVRTKRSLRFGTPEESITRVKKAKLVDLAESYLQRNDTQIYDWRVDVVAVVMGKGNEVIRMEIIKNALS